MKGGLLSWPAELLSAFRCLDHKYAAAALFPLKTEGDFALNANVRKHGGGVKL